MIPDEYKATFCHGSYGSHIIACDYYSVTDCPGTCAMAKKMDKKIIHIAKSGLERFISKWGSDWQNFN